MGKPMECKECEEPVEKAGLCAFHLSLVEIENATVENIRLRTENADLRRQLEAETRRANYTAQHLMDAERQLGAARGEVESQYQQLMRRIQFGNDERYKLEMRVAELEGALRDALDCMTAADAFPDLRGRVDAALAPTGREDEPPAETGEEKCPWNCQAFRSLRSCLHTVKP
jgi:hypothetical protein